MIEETNLKVLSFLSHHKKCKFLIKRILESLPDLMVSSKKNLKNQFHDHMK
jgi:hypothetical protein